MTQPTEASRQAASEFLGPYATVRLDDLAQAFDRRAALEREQVKQEIVEWANGHVHSERRGSSWWAFFADAILRGDHRKDRT